MVGKRRKNSPRSRISVENNAAASNVTNRRKINPSDVMLPEGYEIEVFSENLTTPICMVISEKGNIYIADAGIVSGGGKVYKYVSGSFELIADGFNIPLTGISCFGESIYVSHRGKISKIDPEGSIKDILIGLPSLGDHHNNQVIFGTDGKMYFGQGTATNSGVVGEDNRNWVLKYPFFHDFPGGAINLRGQNFITENFFTPEISDISYTGAFSPYGVPIIRREFEKGYIKASGSILRANPDGSNLEMVAWGLRNPFRLKFDNNNRLFATNHGMDVRGSRPVANSPDEFQIIMYDAWYGWPDFTGGLPVNLPEFKPENLPEPELLLLNHPMLPPKPFAVFNPHSAAMGFDFNYSYDFGPYGDAYIAEFGSEAPGTTGGQPLPKVGHRVSKLDMKTGALDTFAINKSGYAASYTDSGGLERPIDVVFDGMGSMYVVDFGLDSKDSKSFIPGTGVIWRIFKK